MYYEYIYSAIKKECICSDMDAIRGCHTKWSNSERERKILYDITYMWNLKKKKANLWM